MYVLTPNELLLFSVVSLIISYGLISSGFIYLIALLLLFSSRLLEVVIFLEKIFVKKGTWLPGAGFLKFQHHYV